jgi:hypothetical protein
VTFKVNENEPACEAVPLNKPAELNVRPFGKDPLNTLQVTAMARPW